MSHTTKKVLLIFSGYNPRAVYAFLRTINNNGIPYAIIASSEEDSILSTSYKDKVLYIRHKKELDFPDIANGILIIKKIIQAESLLIAPSTEGLNRFLLDARADLEALGCIIPLVNKESYETISDKAAFSELCTKYGILIPREVNISKDSLPFVAKPRKYCSPDTQKALSPIIIKNINDLVSFNAKYDISDFYFQEYIDGKSIYLLYYFDRYGECYKFSQENLIQQPGGKSIVAAISTDYHNGAMSTEYEHLFQCERYRGFVMIEVRQHNEKNYMIEANPRFWGPSQLFVDAGFNFFEVFLYDYYLRSAPPVFPQNIKSTKYFWYGGFLDAMKRNLKVDFYNTNEKKLLDELPEWISHDIYNRDDTEYIFAKECK